MQETPARPTPFIRVAGVSKQYESLRGTLAALEDVTFDVHHGEFVALVGPSGCGKSTLLRIIAGLRSATSGTVTVNGAPVTGPLRNIGMVFQGPVLLRWRRVIDNVLLPIDLAGGRRELFIQHARALLALTGLEEFADRYPHELSGGMQQRVALCRALIQDPELLLMDEPFGALDAMTRDEMNLELLRLWGTRQQRKTILFVTHSIAEAVFLADRVIVMTPRPGRVSRIVPVALPRPRTLEVRASEEFGRQTLELYRLLHVDRARPGRGVA